jgi:predicted bacteriocin transport accessory protein
MAEKKKTQKTRTNAKTEQKPKVVSNVIPESTNDLLNKILICLYVLIILLAVNTVILIFKGNTTTTATEEETTSTEDYDVSMFTKVTADTLKDAVSSSTPKIVYIGRSTCGYCVKFLPALQQGQEDYGYETLYLDITTVTTTDQKNTILELDNEDKFLEENFGGTPMVLLMQDGEIVDTWLGYDEYSEYAAWLEKNGFTKK